MDKLSRKELFTLLGVSSAGKGSLSSENASENKVKPTEAQSQTIMPTNVVFDLEDTSQSEISAEDLDEFQDKDFSWVSDKDVFIQKPAEPPKLTWSSEQAHLHHILSKSVPRMWTYARTRCDTQDPRALRKKLRELLVWLFSKEGFKTLPHAKAPYYIGGREIAGRIDLLVLNQKGQPLLAIEADWAKESTSVCKLNNLANTGIEAAWVIGADVAQAQLRSWRDFADTVSQKSTKSWLKIIHLEQGEVR